MFAILVAGGNGTRLGNLTKNIPKPMLEVGGKPILQHQTEQLKKAGISDIVISEGYQAKVIQDYFGDGTGFNVNITHSDEGNQQLGTAGGIKKALKAIPDNETDVLIMYGDTISDVNIAELIQTHQNGDNPITIWLTQQKLPFGFAEVNDGMVSSFIEKPRVLVNTGISLIKRDIIDSLAEKGDFFGDVIRQYEGRISAYTSNALWLTINNEYELRIAEETLRELRTNQEGNTMPMQT